MACWSSPAAVEDVDAVDAIGVGELDDVVAFVAVVMAVTAVTGGLTLGLWVPVVVVQAPMANTSRAEANDLDAARGRSGMPTALHPVDHHERVIHSQVELPVPRGVGSGSAPRCERGVEARLVEPQGPVSLGVVALLLLLPVRNGKGRTETRGQEGGGALDHPLVVNPIEPLDQLVVGELALQVCQRPGGPETEPRAA